MSTSSASRSAWLASATCRATCSATACCSRPRIRLVAAFDHRDIFLDPDPDAAVGLGRAPAPVRYAAFELAGLRQGEDLQGRRRLPARVQVHCAEPGGAAAAGVERRGADAGRVDPRHPEMRDRPAVVRRHRHVRARVRRDGRGCRRPRQRCPARHRCGAARQGGRRGRQPRHDAARAHRVRGPRRAPQHRLHRQLGRREHLRPGGQHQDRAGTGGTCGSADDRTPAMRC